MHSHASIMFNVLERIPQVDEAGAGRHPRLLRAGDRLLRGAGRARAHVLRSRAGQARHAGEPFAKTATRSWRRCRTRCGSRSTSTASTRASARTPARRCTGGLEPGDVVAILREVAASGQADRRLRPERGRPEPARRGRRVGRQRRRAPALQAGRLHAGEPGQGEAAGVVARAALAQRSRSERLVLAQRSRSERLVLAQRSLSLSLAPAPAPAPALASRESRAFAQRGQDALPGPVTSVATRPGHERRDAARSRASRRPNRPSATTERRPPITPRQARSLRGSARKSPPKSANWRGRALARTEAIITIAQSSSGGLNSRRGEGRRWHED